MVRVSLWTKKTFQNPYVADYVGEHYYAVKFNAEGNETINYYDNTFKNPNYDPIKKVLKFDKNLLYKWSCRRIPDAVTSSDDSSCSNNSNNYMWYKSVTLIIVQFCSMTTVPHCEHIKLCEIKELVW